MILLINQTHDALELAKKCGYMKYLLVILLACTQLHAQDLNKEKFNQVSSNIFKFNTGWKDEMNMTVVPWIAKQFEGKTFNIFTEIHASALEGRFMQVQAVAGEAVMQAKERDQFAKGVVMDYVSMKKFAPPGKVKFNEPEPCGKSDYPLLYFVTGRQGSMDAMGFAGYAKGYGIYFIASADKEFPITKDWLINGFYQWLDRLPNLETPKAVIFSLRIKPGIVATIDDKTAVLPATHELPAEIYFTGTPGEIVEININNNQKGKLVAAEKSGSAIQVRTDANGKAECQFYYTGKDKLVSPLPIDVICRQGEHVERGLIKVGLGLRVEKIKNILGSKSEYSKETPYPLAIIWKSTFYPNMNIGVYLSEAAKLPGWNNRTIGATIQSTWLNQSKEQKPDSGYNGIGRFTYTINNVNLVFPEDFPAYEIDKKKYPAIILRSEGQHMYEITCKPAIIPAEFGAASLKNAIPIPGENYGQQSSIAALSTQYSDSWWQVFEDLICAYNNTNYKQDAALSLIKLIPVYGNMADRFVSVSKIVCNFATGDYGNAFFDLFTMWSGDYIDKIADDDFIKTLTPREQKLAGFAKEFKELVDRSKDAGDRAEINQKAAQAMKEKVDKLYRGEN